MNQYIFAGRNVLDKLRKMAGGGGSSALNFYWKNYFLSLGEDSDTYIISYPKCGRTWLRVILGSYMKLTHVPLEDKLQNVLHVSENKTLKISHDAGNWVPAPCKIKNMSFNNAKYAGKHVVFLVRDPRDVVVSSWYHLRYRERIYKGDLSCFVRDDLVGIRKIIAFMNMWIDNSHVPSSFMMISYEEMCADTYAVVENLFDFIGVRVERELLLQAIEQSSFDSMKFIEEKGGFREPWMRSGVNVSESAMKVRKGKVGGFRKEFSKEDIEFMNMVISETMSGKLPYLV